MLVSDGEDAKSIGAEFLVVLHQIAHQDRLQRKSLAVEFIEFAAWKDGLRRAFG